jgi:putative transcriptional regulator
MNNAREISGSVEGQLLIAVPHMEDPRFRHSVIFMCSHSRSGAVGLVVNKLIDDMPFSDLLQQLDIERSERADAIRVHFGGPVEPGRGFVLHTQEYKIDGTTPVAGGMALTATTDILRDMAKGHGPQDCFLALGYSGWGPGQLDREIQDNGWLVVQPDRDLLFDPETETKWKRAYAKLGVEPGALSQTGGRA